MATATAADLSAKVTEVRKKFLSKYDGSILDDTYDERDVKWVEKEDGLIRSALRSYKGQGNVDKTVNLLNDILLYRAKTKINDLSKSDLHPELLEKNGAYYHGTDKQGHKLLHLRISTTKKGHLINEGKVYISYFFNQHYRQHPEEQIVLVFDFTDAGVTNMDMDLSRFTVNCTSIYYPNVSAYQLMFKMGLALEAIWMIIKGWLDPEASKKTKFVSRKDITNHVDQDQLLPHMIKEDKK